MRLAQCIYRAVASVFLIEVFGHLEELRNGRSSESSYLMHCFFLLLVDKTGFEPAQDFKALVNHLVQVPLQLLSTILVNKIF